MNESLENEIALLKAENARYKEVLKHISLEDDDLPVCCLNAINKNYLSGHYHVIAYDALRGK